MQAPAKKTGWITLAVTAFLWLIDLPGRIEATQWWVRVIMSALDPKVLLGASVVGALFLVLAYGPGLIAKVKASPWTPSQRAARRRSDAEALALIASQEAERRALELRKALSEDMKKERRKSLIPKVQRLITEANPNKMFLLLGPESELTEREQKVAGDFLMRCSGELVQLDGELDHVKVASHLKDHLKHPFTYDDMKRVHSLLSAILKLLREG